MRFFICLAADIFPTTDKGEYIFAEYKLTKHQGNLRTSPG